MGKRGGAVSYAAGRRVAPGAEAAREAERAVEPQGMKSVAGYENCFRRGIGLRQRRG